MIRTKQKLREQQKRFCQLWVEKQNLADAWLAAGYKSKNRDNAKRAASRLMSTNVYVQEYISDLLKEQEQRAEKTTDDVIKELIKIGFSNIQDYLTENNEVVDLSKTPRDKAAAIESIQVDIRHDGGDSNGYVEKVRFKMHSKLTALKELLDRWQGKPRQQIDVKAAVISRELTDEQVRELLVDNCIVSDDVVDAAIAR